MRGGGNDLTGIPLFVSGLPKNCQYSLPEGDAQKYCLSLSLSLNMKHRSSKILTLSLLMASAFFE